MLINVLTVHYPFDVINVGHNPSLRKLNTPTDHEHIVRFVGVFCFICKSVILNHQDCLNKRKKVI
jgi:hypothetical protein